MIPIWVPADSGDEVANRLRASCVSFLNPTDKKDQDINVVQRYAWYKAVPAWASGDFWTVRIDHFIIPLPSSSFPILDSIMEAEHGSDKKPVTFFTTKTILPGGLYTYHRFVHEDGVIQKRNLLGFLDPLATADINATRPLLRDAFHLPSEMQTQDKNQGTPAANGMLYNDAWVKATKLSSSAVRFQGSFVKSEELEDPFSSPEVGQRSGGRSSGNLNCNSTDTSPNGKNQLTPTYTSSIGSG
ncbi:uncharacterized protein LTHEOB_10325 [Lasiodiplodia theobromae]|uniref:uncharacterized protein n=1 Tax=Lasiodiplodia theobromae TaxID=45133 RepID=UPI0015C3BC4B|nr:uncharacterized protein LTHEOB_10325 [Lasiodiplodia theobromae]KAF4539393.1 hypothetical protein LTHEOB_10325 [Lasiodiplodia theobromae]